jgi:trehalose/maltose hydrolase-like predicted phosphorylase
MQDWMLVYNYFDPAEERRREALCTLGNGYFATRGAAEETSADETHCAFLGAGAIRSNPLLAPLH